MSRLFGVISSYYHPLALQKNAVAHFYFERESVDFAKYPASSLCLLQYNILIELASKLSAAATVFSASEDY